MVNVLYCELTPWRGDNEKCRWCNAPRRNRSYCGKECMTAYLNNHYYWRGRVVVSEASRGPCNCPDPITPQLGYFDGNHVKYLKHAKPHRLCAACGDCEEVIYARGDRLTCNHIEPRNGIKMSHADCIHHMNNLEMLCVRDHDLLNSLGNVRSRLISWKVQT